MTKSDQKLAETTQTKHDQKWPQIIKYNIIEGNATENDPIWPKTTRNNQLWSWMTKMTIADQD